MDLVWLLILIAVVVVSIVVLRPFRHSVTAFFWPWYDGGRGDRAQEAYIAEEEIKRSQDQSRDRDLAP